jgi:hypothetical protein
LRASFGRVEVTAIAQKRPSAVDFLAIWDSGPWRFFDSFSRFNAEQVMGKPRDEWQKDLFWPALDRIINLDYRLARLAESVRFKSSKAAGTALGLTPVLNQSGESKRVGRASLCGDG